MVLMEDYLPPEAAEAIWKMAEEGSGRNPVPPRPSGRFPVKPGSAVAQKYEKQQQEQKLKTRGQRMREKAQIAMKGLTEGGLKSTAVPLGMGIGILGGYLAMRAGGDKLVKKLVKTVPEKTLVPILNKINKYTKAQYTSALEDQTGMLENVLRRTQKAWGSV